jgi:hypothetical protein
MTGVGLMVGFCNQVTSPHHAAGVMDLDGTGWRWLPLDALEIPPGGNGGLCGTCRLGEDIVVATQTTPPRLARFDLTNSVFTANDTLTGCVDVHSLTLFDGSLYLASTGTNEIYRVRVRHNGFGPPELHWCYPGVGNDGDHVHLNGVTATPDGLVATCFGPRRADGGWGDQGVVFLVEPFTVLHDGLSHPHSPLYFEGRLFFTESRSHRIHSLRRVGLGQWQTELPIEVGGYARGLAYRDGELWAAISAERQVSRSRGTLSAPQIAKRSSSQVLRIDLSSRAIAERRTLTGLGEEVFDLLFLPDGAALAPLHEALADRISEMHQVGSILQLDYAEALGQLATAQQRNQLLTGEIEAAKADAARKAQALLLERNFSEQLAQLLRTVEHSRLWRAAEQLRRLTGRAPVGLAVRRPPPLPEPADPPEAASAPVPTAMAGIFRDIYVSNTWGSDDSRSGTGSDQTQTGVIRGVLPGLFRELGVRSLLDIPCGDFHWMRLLNLDLDYIGADVVPELIAANEACYGGPRRHFEVMDIATDDLPRVDLVFCRDLLVHFAFADAQRAIANLKRSGATWLLTTTFSGRQTNDDIRTGEWRPLNLQLPPFSLPPPVQLINEACTEWDGEWADKCLGLWRFADL